jgi:hypothetical protein
MNIIRLENASDFQGDYIPLKKNIQRKSAGNGKQFEDFGVKRTL